MTPPRAGSTAACAACQPASAGVCQLLPRTGTPSVADPRIGSRSDSWIGSAAGSRTGEPVLPDRFGDGTPVAGPDPAGDPAGRGAASPLPRGLLDDGLGSLASSARRNQADSTEAKIGRNSSGSASSGEYPTAGMDEVSAASTPAAPHWIPWDAWPGTVRVLGGAGEGANSPVTGAPSDGRREALIAGAEWRRAATWTRRRARGGRPGVR